MRRPRRDPGPSTDKWWARQGLRQGATSSSSVGVLGGPPWLLGREWTAEGGGPRAVLWVREDGRGGEEDALVARGRGKEQRGRGPGRLWAPWGCGAQWEQFGEQGGETTGPAGFEVGGHWGPNWRLQVGYQFWGWASRGWSWAQTPFESRLTRGGGEREREREHLSH